MFEVDCNGLAAPGQYISSAARTRRGTVDADDFRTQIGKQHAAKRSGTDARQFDDLNSTERTHDLFSGSMIDR